MLSAYIISICRYDFIGSDLAKLHSRDESMVIFNEITWEQNAFIDCHKVSRKCIKSTFTQYGWNDYHLQIVNVVG